MTVRINLDEKVQSSDSFNISFTAAEATLDFQTSHASVWYFSRGREQSAILLRARRFMELGDLVRDKRLTPHQAGWLREMAPRVSDYIAEQLGLYETLQRAITELSEKRLSLQEEIRIIDEEIGKKLHQINHL